MLCKELMYGDWCCDKHGFPMQITNVGEDYAYATFEGNEGVFSDVTLPCKLYINGKER